jgi:hypothetical protein
MQARSGTEVFDLDTYWVVLISIFFGQLLCGVRYAVCGPYLPHAGNRLPQA